MLMFDKRSKQTRLLEKAYRETANIHERIGENPELQKKLNIFQTHLGRTAAASHIADLDRRAGNVRKFEEQVADYPNLATALQQPAKAGEVKSAVSQLSGVVRQLPAAVRLVIGSAVLFGLNELHRMTHGTEPPQNKSEEKVTPRVKMPREKTAAQPAKSETLEGKILTEIRNSKDYDVPKNVNTLSEWASYLIAERNDLEAGSLLSRRGFPPMPKDGYIIVDVPKTGAPKIFNFKNEDELVQGADLTGQKWREKGQHPAISMVEALKQLGGRDRVGFYSSWEEAVRSAQNPQNKIGREEVLKEIQRVRGPGENAASEKPGEKAPQTEKRVRAVVSVGEAEKAGVRV